MSRSSFTLFKLMHRGRSQSAKRPAAAIDAPTQDQSGLSHISCTARGSFPSGCVVSYHRLSLTVGQNPRDSNIIYDERNNGSHKKRENVTRCRACRLFRSPKGCGSLVSLSANCYFRNETKILMKPYFRAIKGVMSDNHCTLVVIFPPLSYPAFLAWRHGSAPQKYEREHSARHLRHQPSGHVSASSSCGLGIRRKWRYFPI